MPRTAYERGAAQLLTCRPDGSDLRYLGRLGHLAGVAWTDTMPGGNEQLTATLAVPPTYRHTALDPGRIIRAVKGSVQFEGILDEPVPGDGGWQLTARGAGTWGSLYQAIWTTWTAADVIGQAIGRGLGWVAGSLAGGYLAEKHDSGSQTVTDFLDAYTQPGSQVWRVRPTPGGNQLDVYPIPATPTRLLITTVPAARTLAGYINALYVRYQATADAGNTPATYGVTSVTLPASIARHGRQEDYWDLSAAGVMTAATAQGYGNAALAKYLAASWAGPFQVAHGQYLTMGGTPVDLACEHAGEVVRLIMADGPYGGEVTPAPPVTFPVGQVEYHDTDGTLTVTPHQSWRADLGGIESWIGGRAAAREAARAAAAKAAAVRVAAAKAAAKKKAIAARKAAAARKHHHHK